MKRAGPGWLLLALAGLAAAFGAFLPFYTYPNGIDVTVWSRGLFPTAALIPLVGVAVGAEAVFVLVRGHEPRSPFLNFTWEQVRLAAGAFMILLTLSYLLQDRAGGTLGTGYALLAVSALATFAGGVLTRRAQLARAAENAEEREPRPVIGLTIATVGRASSHLAKNVADRSHNLRVRLGERREARAAARKDAAEQAAAQRAEMEAAAAERAAAETTVGEEPAQPAPPTATVETLPSGPHPPAATLDELPTDEPVEHRQPGARVETPVPDPIDATEALDVSGESADDVDDTAELAVADAGAVGEQSTVEQPRATKLSTVPSDTDPDAPVPTDGEAVPPVHDDATEDEEEREREKEKQKERADTGTEGPPRS